MDNTIEQMLQYENLYLRLVKGGKTKKLKRKVSKYRDKKGIIAKEQKEAVDWFIDLCKQNPIKMNCIEYTCIQKKIKNASKSRRRYIRRGEYFIRKMNSIIIKNRYRLSKRKKSNGLVYFYDDDIIEFITLMYTSYNEGKLEDFVDVPDVSYILRRLKETGIAVYFKTEKVS